MNVDRAAIVQILRDRDLPDRADWVERTLPPAVDSDRNSSLLAMLGIDPAALAAVELVRPTS